MLQVLFNASQSPDSGQREGAFRIFTTTPGIIEKQHENTVVAVFTKGFKDDEVFVSDGNSTFQYRLISWQVRISAMQAFASFFGAVSKKGQKKYYVLVPEILNILPPLKESGDSENLTKGLIALIELAEEAPTMFKGLFHNLVQFSIAVIQDADLGDQVRQNALELMGTFADYNAAMCRKDSSYTSDMVTQCLSLMTDVGMDDDDASEWNASEDVSTDCCDLEGVSLIALA